jgi:hypothetical protein
VSASAILQLVVDLRNSRFVEDLKSWPKENHRIRAGFAALGVVAVVVGAVIAAVMGVPADMPDTGINVGGLLLFILVVLPLSAAPLAVYVRYVTTLPVSVLTGIVLVGQIVWAFAFMVTSTSSTAALAIFGPVVYNWAVVAGGVILDRFVQWVASR